MAKWGVTADTQFDEQLSYASILPNGISSRLQDAIDCFDWVVKTAKESGCRGLTVVGDVFDDRTTIGLCVLDSVCRAFHRASDGLELKVVPGNHDSYLRSARINSVQVFAGIADVFEAPSIHYPFAFVPWIEDDDEFDAAIKWAVNSPAKPRFLFTHCMIEGAVPQALGLRPLSMLRPDRWDYVFLGDVHDPVVLADNVRYCGSPMQWHYGDAGRQRGFIIFDDETCEVQFVENTLSPRFHLLDAVDVGEVRDQDFVRIRTEDPVVAAEVLKSVEKRHLRRIETLAVEVADAPARLAISVSDEHESVLRVWIKHQGLEDVDGLIELGVDILVEASNG